MLQICFVYAPETEILDDDEIGSRKYAKKQVYSGRKAVYLSGWLGSGLPRLRVITDL